jgi:hypothetical protein
MKNIDRVRQNSASKRTSSQVQTSITSSDLARLFEVLKFKFSSHAGCILGEFEIKKFDAELEEELSALNPAETFDLAERLARDVASINYRLSGNTIHPHASN